MSTDLIYVSQLCTQAVLQWNHIPLFLSFFLIERSKHVIIPSQIFLWRNSGLSKVSEMKVLFLIFLFVTDHHWSNFKVIWMLTPQNRYLMFPPQVPFFICFFFWQVGPLSMFHSPNMPSWSGPTSPSLGGGVKGFKGTSATRATKVLAKCATVRKVSIFSGIAYVPEARRPKLTVVDSHERFSGPRWPRLPGLLVLRHSHLHLQSRGALCFSESDFSRFLFLLLSTDFELIAQFPTAVFLVVVFLCAFFPNI